MAPPFLGMRQHVRFGLKQRHAAANPEPINSWKHYSRIVNGTLAADMANNAGSCGRCERPRAIGG
jgi:hypothetical protein